MKKHFTGQMPLKNWIICVLIIITWFLKQHVVGKHPFFLPSPFFVGLSIGLFLHAHTRLLSAKILIAFRRHWVFGPKQNQISIFKFVVQVQDVRFYDSYLRFQIPEFRFSISDVGNQMSLVIWQITDLWCEVSALRIPISISMCSKVPATFKPIYLFTSSISSLINCLSFLF